VASPFGVVGRGVAVVSAFVGTDGWAVALGVFSMTGVEFGVAVSALAGVAVGLGVLVAVG
jgi:hypothetical protein